MAVKDNQGNILRVGQVRKLTCYLVQCTEVVQIYMNGQDIIKIFICQEISLDH